MPYEHSLLSPHNRPLLVLGKFLYSVAYLKINAYSASAVVFSTGTAIARKSDSSHA